MFVNNVRSCKKCQKLNPFGFDTLVTELHPIPVVSPWYHVEIDLTSFPRSSSGNTFAFALVDLFTKFAVAKPIPCKSGATIKSTLADMFMIYGYPKILSSDQGREYLNGDVIEYLNLHNITQKTYRWSGVTNRISSLREKSQFLKRLVSAIFSWKISYIQIVESFR